MYHTRSEHTFGGPVSSKGEIMTSMPATNVAVASQTFVVESKAWYLWIHVNAKKLPNKQREKAHSKMISRPRIDAKGKYPHNPCCVLGSAVLTQSDAASFQKYCTWYITGRP
jgi:hypothetical protein